MSPQAYERKLTAILSADVAGYSRLMGEDEDLTINTLTGHREMMTTLIEKHKGRVVDSPGDNLLPTFPSVTQAIDCAVEIQREMAERNADLPEDKRMDYRIGVNVGDVVEEGERIYGDGVNIAARLESLSEPGGICISGFVYHQVKNRLKLEYEYLGEQGVKNIKEPVPVYKVLSLPKVSIRPSIKDNQPFLFSDKPSIAVLPFVNISGDPEQEYFSDGMTEELIGALAKLEGLKVISRTSAFHFKGKDMDLRTIGEKLKVDNVLEGSVRKAGNKLRISAQLIKVDDDTHLWAETYDRELKDVFTIQDEISQAVVENLKTKLLGKKTEPLIKDYTENMEAYESFIKGRYFYYSYIEGELEKALQYYKQAITLDPNYAPAHSAIAEWYWSFPLLEGQEASKEDAYTNAKEAIKKALEIDNNLAEAHATLGLIRWIYEWDWNGAEEAFETALDLNPGSSKSHYDYAYYLATVVEDFDKSISESRKAVELDPLSGNAHFIFGVSLFVSNQFDQAIEQLRIAREMIPNHWPSASILIWAYKEKGMLEEAHGEIKKGLELFPKNPPLLMSMSRIYSLKGEKEKTRAILDELIERSKKEYVSPMFIALLYADLGEIDQKFEYLEKGYEKRDIWFSFIKAFTSLHFLRTDPRFIAFLKKMGLET